MRDKGDCNTCESGEHIVENHLNHLFGDEQESFGEVNESATFKTETKGDDKLIPHKDWVPQSEMNTDEKVLKHPIFEQAFKAILKKWKPTKNIAFMSLCTATRPYSKSNKYKEFTKRFGDIVDFIVVSNGGFIPKPFWSSYPYLNYDAPHDDTGAWDKLYQDTMYDRIKRFFGVFEYEYVIANFRPTLRNYEPAKKGLQEMKDAGRIKDFIIIPEIELYEKAKADGFRGEDVERRRIKAKEEGRELTRQELKPNGSGAIFPDLHKFIIDELEAQAKKWSPYTDPSENLF